jgi:hypothetical protein
MKDGKSVFVVLALVVFITYVLRGFLGHVSALFLVPLDRLLFITHSISPVVMWMFLGLLIGLVYGSYIAIKKYRLDFKLLVYPIAILVAMLGFVMLASYIKGEGNSGENGGKSEGSNNERSRSVTSSKPAEFNKILNKGIEAAENKEYKSAEKYFKQAALMGNGSSRLDSLAAVYSKTAEDKCRLFRRDSQLKYIPNHYYKFAAVLTGKLTPEICK